MAWDSRRNCWHAATTHWTAPCSGKGCQQSSCFCSQADILVTRKLSLARFQWLLPSGHGLTGADIGVVVHRLRTAAYNSTEPQDTNSHNQISEAMPSLLSTMWLLTLLTFDGGVSRPSSFGPLQEPSRPLETQHRLCHRGRASEFVPRSRQSTSVHEL